MKLNMRKGESLYINGAFVRVDRRVCIELLNEATFLLEKHVLDPGQADTHWKQLYFIIQCILIDPKSSKYIDAGLEKIVESLRKYGNLGAAHEHKCDIVDLTSVDRDKLEVLKNIRHFLLDGAPNEKCHHDDAN